MTIHTKALVCTATVTALLWSGIAAAQDAAANYPSRPVSVIVVVSPGGSAEAQVRIFTPKLQEGLGRPFVFDFKPGAGGTIGYAAAARSAPDGYTLLATTPAFTTTPAFMTLPYDPIKDLAPVVQLSRQSGIVVVNPGVPVNNLQEYVAYARANPNKLNFGTMGAGSTAHLVGAWLNDLTGTQTTFIHYKGAQLSADLIAGNVQVTVGSNINLSPLVKSGKLRALALAGPARSAEYPDLRTAREQGVEFDYPSWVGITVPTGTPPAVISKLNAEFMKILKLPETQQQSERLGSSPAGGTPAEFGKLIVEEINRWKQLVKQTGIKPD
jgi:tripartite-type tricarboxylate transporter receptor subunit TctC